MSEPPAPSERKSKKRRLRRISKADSKNERTMKKKKTYHIPLPPIEIATKLQVPSKDRIRMASQCRRILKSEINGNVRVVLVPSLLWASAEDTPPLLRNSGRSGCSMVVKCNGDIKGIEYSAEGLASLIEPKQNNHERSYNSNVMSSARSIHFERIRSLLSNEFDQQEDIMKATRRFTKIVENFKARGGERRERCFLGEDELAWFADTEGPLCLSQLVLLRRLALPLIIKNFKKSEEVKLVEDVEEKARLGESGIKVMDFSFLDVLIKVESYGEKVVECLVQRAQSIQQFISGRFANCSTAGLGNGSGSSGRRSKNLGCYHHRELLQLLVNALYKWDGMYEHPKLHRLIRQLFKRDAPASPKRIIAESTSMKGWRQAFIQAVTSHSIPKGEINDERSKLLKDFLNHYRSERLPGTHRVMDGTALMTDNDMSCEEFTRKATLMAEVNATFPRLIDPNRSRPMFQHLANELPESAISRLKRIFFTNDGCLNRSIINDVDIGPKHGYIRFHNHLCGKERKDLRWQLPIRLHYTSWNSKEGNSGYLVPTRQEVSSVLMEHNIIDSEREDIHDLGLLIGGTEDQSLHHDIARRTTAWLPQEAVSSNGTIAPVVGWEIDRLVYNEAMANPCAPSSLILGMGPTGRVHLGVQRDHVQYVDRTKRRCKVLGGKPGQEFKVLRENEFLVVLELEKGCMFTGDFPHAGVRNFGTDTEEDRRMRILYEKIAFIDDEYPDDHYKKTQEVIEMLCQFKGLDRICRLHCSTELKYHAEMKIPRNAVGFVNCQPNPPNGVEE